MRIGLQVPNFTWAGGPAGLAQKLAEIAGAAEDAGFDSLWVMDHYFQIPPVGPAENDMLEAYAALGYCAALTNRIRLGTMATGVTYRHPGILLKTVTTLDVLSGGRAWLGIGAAWFEREHAGMGVPFPPIAERFERLEETLQIAKQMWSGSSAPYQGKHYQLAETLCRPLPLSRPHLPVLVAGSGEKKTLRLVARYSDACNLFGDAPVIRTRLDILKRHCDTEGRDYATIEKTCLGTAHLAPGKSSAADIVAQCRALADAGIQQALFNLPNVEEIVPLEIFGREIIPAVADF